MTAEELIAKVPHLPAPAPAATRLLQVFARPEAGTPLGLGTNEIQNLLLETLDALEEVKGMLALA